MYCEYFKAKLPKNKDTLDKDCNMNIALQWADMLTKDVTLPEGLSDVREIAKFVHDIDPAVWSYGVGRISKTRVRLLAVFTLKMEDIIDSLYRMNPDTKEMISLTLRLWSGCLSAAKLISIDNEIDLAYRYRIFRYDLDKQAKKDKIFRAGMEAAPIFKAEFRGQEYSLDGVPKNSPVRRYA